MKNTKAILTSITVVIATVAIVYAGNSFQKSKPMSERKKDTVTSVEDSVEVVGTPTNDDPWKEMERLVKEYYTNSGVEYKGDVKVIDDNGDKEKIIEQFSFESTLFGNSFQCRMGDIEIINKEKIILAIDHANKRMSLTSQQQAIGNDNGFFDIRVFRKMMNDKNAQAKVTQLGEEKVLTIDNITDPAIQGYSIYYSPGTHRINKIMIGMLRATPLGTQKRNFDADATFNNPMIDGVEEYYYYMVVLFRSFKSLHLKEKDFHPENKFITIHNKKIELADAYKDYQLLNTIQP